MQFNVTADAYLNRIISNGKGNALAIYDVDFLVALIGTTPVRRLKRFKLT